MITLLTGRTGSGKSYKAVELILKKINDGEKVYTNILLNIDFPNYHYIDELGVKNFLSYIEETFKEVDNLDSKKNIVNNSEYFNSNFFIDEAHLVGFKRKIDSIQNWLTIHRHFNQNITVITQIPSNIHRDYLDMFHEHIDMIPPNKRLSKSSMGYRQYDAYRGDRTQTKFFKPNLDYFELYSSGNKEVGMSSDVYKIVGVLGFLGVAAFFMFSFGGSFLGKYSNEAVAKIEGSKMSVTPMLAADINKTNDLVENNSTNYYDVVFCDTKDGCYFEGHKYTLQKFTYAILPKFLHTKYLVMNSSDWFMYKYELISLK